MFSNYISSNTPVLIIFILDQSSRMAEPFKGNLTKDEYQCMIVNNFVNDLIFSNSAGDKIKDRFYIAIIGHSNNQANEIRTGYLSLFADNPLQINKVKRKFSDGAGGLVEIEQEEAIYIEPFSLGSENQLDAFKLSKEWAISWFDKRKYCSTLIVNISGGFSLNWKESTLVVNEIKKSGVNEDNPFMFNLLLDGNVKGLHFPDLKKIYCESFTNHLYFEWSSYVTENIIHSALRFDLSLLKSSKLYSNQNIESILNLINFGS
jgi:hypothetical protein